MCIPINTDHADLDLANAWLSRTCRVAERCDAGGGTNALLLSCYSQERGNQQFR